MSLPASRHAGDLALLGAVWGASFLFMRMGAADFGPVALVFVRVGLAGLVLLPLLVAQGELGALRRHWRGILLVGVVNSGIPFLLFAVGALALTAALMSVFNATASIWGALVAWLWLGERLGRSRALGLAIGVAGVVGLSWGKADFRPGTHGVSPALGIAACVAAALCYGIGANLSRRLLQGVPPMAVAAGSQLGAALVLAGPAWWWWPSQPPGGRAWGAALALAVLCTGLAYGLFYRLLARAGTATAMSVTFLIPGFAMLWGWVALGERPTPLMLGGCAVILLGTALTTGLLRGPADRKATPRSTEPPAAAD